MSNLKNASRTMLIKTVLAVATVSLLAWITSSWTFSLIIISGVMIHEQGHVWAMRHCGVSTPGFFLIPFIGGAAIAQSQPESEWDQSFIVIMGPMIGILNTMALVGLYLYTGNPLWASGAIIVSAFNLFNLLPIHPLDGGRLLYSMAHTIGGRLPLSVMFSGVMCSVFGFFALGMPLFLIIGIVAYMEYGAERRRQVSRSEYEGFRLLCTASSVSSVDNGIKAMEVMIALGEAFGMPPEDCRIARMDLEQIRKEHSTPTMIPMNWTQTICVLGVYVVMATVLYTLMSSLLVVPGVPAFSEILRGKL